MAPQRPSPVLPTAMPSPIFERLKDKRVVLASGSPRRKDIFENVGFKPEIIPSTFSEDLSKGDFEGRLADYPIATAGEKAMEVYERLMRENDSDPAQLVISADTVVIFPPEKETAEGGSAHGETSEILEKPLNRAEQPELRGCNWLYPIVEAPGFKLQSISCSTLVHFFENTREEIQAYVEHGEGHDRAGGFAIQGLGGLLIDRVDGSYDNCVGFPSSQFWKWMSRLDEEGTFNDI
ncbi:hypothetical protein CcaverHIS002_0107210 [Cutaneotrichosporon cavernicola]|uniref:Maf/Ham1 n=1 Tax=Cutaneotrichosporon cavernicola TaxID=279322 RepID=A0AA48HYS0_9TREE|nr:uncharacterized protein CcaverHIS019_0107170 [Cutaneotrichosporon cavernicola]BEI80192.1 hypothetical protein CcaverHIS002_0107210 [Cutaneotrichosporon cavernicola]BEI87999.1 hypothetical protein CcaverHIS019_0107170 [Cutaneotrichosporon cavernicola]BEI95775.1 hypothetical protein CcaverHIS631_0107240 [Cutaneotrichosporon cavernicola]